MENSLVFISYSHTDHAITEKLIQDLRQAGIEVWIDHEGLRIGTPVWEEAIRQAIRECGAVILMASPEARQSRFVRGELSIAEMYQRPVFPLWVAGKVWEECVPLHLIGAQYADARDARYPEAFNSLIRSLKGLPPENEEIRFHRLNFIPRNPYKGLRAFTGKDKRDFFGRQTLIDHLISDLKILLRANKERFLGIIGPSGSGKSSVVMAGLIPCLQEGAAGNSAEWHYPAPVLPGVRPLESLAISLADALKISISTVLEDLHDNPRGLHLLAKRIRQQPDEMVVLVVDQFEELFTQTVDPLERDSFIDLLVTAATEPDGAVIVIVTLRADFYDRPMNYAHLGRLLDDHSRSILPMTIADLRDVIEKPARLPDVQLVYEDGLVGDLLFEVRGQAGALPLLQFALDQLVEQRQGNLLTYEAYQKLGGVRGALANHADVVYNNLPSAAHQEMTRELFLRMIEPGETEQDTTRRRVPLSDLKTDDAEKTNILRELIEIFTRERLLTTNKIRDRATVEVSHEALIREWSLLADWVRIERDDIRLQRIINNDAHEWVRRGRRPDDLYRGTKLAEAYHWAERNLMVSVLEREFIDAALLAEQEHLAEKVRTDTLRQQAAVLREKVDHLQQITTAVSTTLDYQKVLDTVLDLGASIIHEQQSDAPLVSAVFLFEGNAGTLKIVNSRGLSEEDTKIELPGQQGILEKALHQVDPIFASMPDPELQVISAFQPCRSLLAIPLQAGFEYYGVLVFGSVSAHAFSEDYGGLIKDIGIKTTVALQNSEIYQKILQERERVVAVEEDARKKLARDLHDGPTQSIAAIAMRVNYVRRIVKHDPEKAIEELMKVEDIARRTTREIRHMLFTLRPLILETQGLAPALYQLGEKVKEMYSINTIVDARPEVEKWLDGHAQGVAFYIIEEAVTNACKHAQPNNIWIRLDKHDGAVVLEVEDDGVGFDTGAIQGNYSQRGSLGMVNIRERAELINGSVDIASEIGAGTKVQVVIPVKEA